MYKTILENRTEEIVEKKSKFIADIFYVDTTEMAEEKLNTIRKKYYDARHHCFAYRISVDEGIIEKVSDDGEPSGTAGAPMLNLLVKRELANVLVVVTRYFGGILLGTGGLVRAYTEATNKVIGASNLTYEQLGFELEVEIQYKDLEHFKYYCNKNKIVVGEVEYGQNIICKIDICLEEKEELKEKLEKNGINIISLKKLRSKNIRKPI